MTVKSVPFWNGVCDAKLCEQRVQILKDVYNAQGTKHCDFHFDTTYMGSEIKYIPAVTTAAVCCNYCTSDPDCKYWSWNGPDGDLHCSLKTSNKNALHKPGVISGSGKSTPPPTPPPTPP